MVSPVARSTIRWLIQIERLGRHLCFSVAIILVALYPDAARCLCVIAAAASATFCAIKAQQAVASSIVVVVVAAAQKPLKQSKQATFEGNKNGMFTLLSEWSSTKDEPAEGKQHGKLSNILI